jgi:phosphoglycerate dehydrogenase-like enzyme
MNIVLLQSRLTDEEIQKIINEFPQYLFLAPSEVTYKNLGDEEWSRVEILYGNKLSVQELEKAHQLRWIHSPFPNISPLCLNEIEKRGNIIVTSTKEENTAQIGEYVIGGVLAFAKNLFHWMEADRNPLILWDSKWRDSMWTLSERTFLQIGLGSVGTEISRLAKEFRMRVWGVKENRSFHNHCHKVFTYEDLPTVLPMADVACIALPRGHQKQKWFTRKEIELMKDDSILVIAGYKGIIDEEALAEVATSTQKFRGILLDAFYQVPVSPHSKLWTIPNIVITPEVAPRPKSSEKESYRLFRFNMRQYLHGNFTDMRNIIGTKQLFTT